MRHADVILMKQAAERFNRALRIARRYLESVGQDGDSEVRARHEATSGLDAQWQATLARVMPRMWRDDYELSDTDRRFANEIMAGYRKNGHPVR